MFRKLLDEGQAGDNVGLLLRGTKREEVERGQVCCKPGSVTPHTKFECEVYILSKDEGGCHTPFFNNYRPQFYCRTTAVTGACELPEGIEMVMPGDNVKMTVKLIAPIAMEEGLRFAIREGGRTVRDALGPLPGRLCVRERSSAPPGLQHRPLRGPHRAQAAPAHRVHRRLDAPHARARVRQPEEAIWPVWQGRRDRRFLPG